MDTRLCQCLFTLKASSTFCSLPFFSFYGVFWYTVVNFVFQFKYIEHIIFIDYNSLIHHSLSYTCGTWISLRKLGEYIEQKTIVCFQHYTTVHPKLTTRYFSRLMCVCLCICMCKEKQYRVMVKSTTFETRYLDSNIISKIYKLCGLR